VLDPKVMIDEEKLQVLIKKLLDAMVKTCMEGSQADRIEKNKIYQFVKKKPIYLRHCRKSARLDDYLLSIERMKLDL